MRRTLILSLAVLITGCAPTMIPLSVAPADVNVASAMLGPGTSTIKGSAFMRKPNGEVVTCAGSDVFLIPATPSASSEMHRVFGGDKGYLERGADPIVGGGKVVVSPEPNRKSVCNALGFFTFANARAGKWYVITTVLWTLQDQPQGGTMLGNAEVADGQEIEIVISQ